MKKALLAVAAALVATTASATISGSSHDMTLFVGGTGAKCAYCHMPHNGATGAGAPLWARNIDYTPTGGYNYFSSTSGGQAKPTALNNATRACLSCHDGTIAVATVLTANGNGSQTVAGSTNTTKTLAASPANVGTDLSNDHPVSVLYTNGGTNPAGLAASPASSVFALPGGYIECTSCHNAHNAAGVANSYPNRQFMVAYTGDFCSACHSQK